MRPSLKRSIYFDCPHCHGTGLVKTPESMSLDVMRRLAIAANDQTRYAGDWAGHVCSEVGILPAESRQTRAACGPGTRNRQADYRYHRCAPNPSWLWMTCGSARVARPKQIARAVSLIGLAAASKSKPESEQGQRGSSQGRRRGRGRDRGRDRDQDRDHDRQSQSRHRENEMEEDQAEASEMREPREPDRDDNDDNRDAPPAEINDQRVDESDERGEAEANGNSAQFSQEPRQGRRRRRRGGRRQEARPNAAEQGAESRLAPEQPPTRNSPPTWKKVRAEIEEADFISTLPIRANPQE